MTLHCTVDEEAAMYAVSLAAGETDVVTAWGVGRWCGSGVIGHDGRPYEP